MQKQQLRLAPKGNIKLSIRHLYCPYGSSNEQYRVNMFIYFWLFFLLFLRVILRVTSVRSLISFVLLDFTLQEGRTPLHYAAALQGTTSGLNKLYNLLVEAGSAEDVVDVVSF